MKNQVKQLLLKHKKKTISIDEMVSQFSNVQLSYRDFAKIILSLEEDGIIEMVKAKGRNNRNPSLANTYRIHRHLLKEEYHEEIMNYRFHFDPSIQLDSYFQLDASQWKKDLPLLEKIHQYIQTNGFPSYEVPAPERSVELVGDEKWIEEKQGKELLERIGLWEKMKVMPVSDPLMFAINYHELSKPLQKHLIVENKTTYQALLDALQDTSFSTLIYGSGNKIIKSIEQFDRQLPIPNVKNEFYYFGDIDRSGIFIWYRLNQKQPVKLALPFYLACIEKMPLTGKTNQRMDEEAMNHFLANFNKQSKQKLKEMLVNGNYYPQEVLRTKELQNIWRQATWN
jgi:hypothetical protein